MIADESGSKRAAALRLLGWNDTAVIEDAATVLVMERTARGARMSPAESMAIVCEALTAQQAENDFEGSETILWVLSPAWKSGAVDVPSLLREVLVSGNENARCGATIAIEWLHIGQ